MCIHEFIIGGIVDVIRAQQCYVFPAYFFRDLWKYRDLAPRTEYTLHPTTHARLRFRRGGGQHAHAAHGPRPTSRGTVGGGGGGDV